MSSNRSIFPERLVAEPTATERMETTAATEERIVVALDASPQSLVALRVAAHLAATMQAELQGLFVEDANLFHLCNSPFCREIGLRTAVVRQLESHTVERQLRVLAAEMRRSLARIAGDAQVRWSFQVARGTIEQELLGAAEHALLLSLGRTGWLAGKRLGSTTRTLVQQARRPLLILDQHDRLTHPLTVLYNGSASADRALTLAVRLAQRAGQPLAVFLISTEAEASEWQARLQSFVQTQNVPATFVWLNRVNDIGQVLLRLTQASFVLPLEYADLLNVVEGPVLLVP